MKIHNHNKEAIDKINKMFEVEDRVCIVHATGTGKSYISLQVMYDFLISNDSKVIYMTSYNGIINNIKSKLNSFGYTEEMKKRIIFKNYRSLSNSDKNLKAGMVILDEYHHLGAPTWTEYINNFLENNQNIKILGTSATSIRNFGHSNEEDLSKTFFQNNVASVYELSDAIIDGVLPEPKYFTSLISIENELMNVESIFNEYDIEVKNKIKIVKDKLKSLDTKTDILKENLKTNGKYIYFCPPGGDIEFIKNQVLANLDIENYKFYSVHSNNSSKKNLSMQNEFENDDSDRLRIMFAIDMYNEGIHVSNIDGVIMGRGTKSNNVFYQQLGRCLSVNSKSSVVIDLMSNIYEIYKLSKKVNRLKEKKMLNYNYGCKELRDDFSFGLDTEVIDILDSLEEINKIKEKNKDYNVNLKKIRLILESDCQISPKINGKSNYLYTFMRINKVQILKDSSKGLKLLKNNEDFSNFEDAIYIVSNSVYFENTYNTKIDKIYSNLLSGEEITSFKNYIYSNREKIINKAHDGLLLEQFGFDSSEFRKEIRIYEENMCPKQFRKYKDSIEIITNLIKDNIKITRLSQNNNRNPHYEFLIVNKDKIKTNAIEGYNLKNSNQDFSEYENEMCIYEYIQSNTYNSKLQNLCEEIEQLGKVTRVLSNSKINPNYNFLNYNKQKIIDRVDEFRNNGEELELTENELYIYNFLKNNIRVDRLLLICNELKENGTITRIVNGKLSQNYKFISKNKEKIKQNALEGLMLSSNNEDFSNYVNYIYIYQNYIEPKEKNRRN